MVLLFGCFSLGGAGPLSFPGRHLSPEKNIFLVSFPVSPHSAIRKKMPPSLTPFHSPRNWEIPIHLSIADRSPEIVPDSSPISPFLFIRTIPKTSPPHPEWHVVKGISFLDHSFIHHDEQTGAQEPCAAECFPKTRSIARPICFFRRIGRTKTPGTALMGDAFCKPIDHARTIIDRSPMKQKISHDSLQAC